MGNIWDVYDGLLVKMRQLPMTLQEIGDSVGCTRERVRQLLMCYEGTTKIHSFLTRQQMANLLGCTEHRLIRLEKNNKVKPIRSGASFYYPIASAGELANLVKRFCLCCGAELCKYQQKYCAKCGQDYRRNSYPFRSGESKIRFYFSQLRWRKRNPEKWREIANRGNSRYRLKQKLLAQIEK